MTFDVVAGALTQITRRRESPGAYRDGIWTPGAVSEAVLFASVQPVGLEDVDGVAGAQFSDRRRIFVGLLDDTAVPGADPDSLMWGGDTLLWAADVLRWGATPERVADAAGPPLVAAYEGRGGDTVVIDGANFRVVSAMLWPSHVEAVVLREP